MTTTNTKTTTANHALGVRSNAGCRSHHGGGGIVVSRYVYIDDFPAFTVVQCMASDYVCGFAVIHDCTGLITSRSLLLSSIATLTQTRTVMFGGLTCY
jgi:hypothetical protein